MVAIATALALALATALALPDVTASESKPAAAAAAAGAAATKERAVRTWTERIGEGVCLLFGPASVIDQSDSDELIASRFAANLDGGRTLIAESMTHIPNGNTPATRHVRANMHQRVYLSTDAGAHWSKRGEAAPNCAIGAPECNTVNVSWSGPLFPCEGTAVCGGVPEAQHSASDLGMLQWASRYKGLGPTLTSSYIGVHHPLNSRGQIASVLRRPLQIRGLPPLSTFGCPRGVDQAPLRVSACNVLQVGTRLLLPVAAFLNSSRMSRDAELIQAQRAAGANEAVCYGHRSSLLLLSTDRADGLIWDYVSTIVVPSDVPASDEGPNECTIAELPASSVGGDNKEPRLIVTFRSSEPKNGSAGELRRASYRTSPYNIYAAHVYSIIMYVNAACINVHFTE